MKIEDKLCKNCKNIVDIGGRWLAESYECAHIAALKKTMFSNWKFVLP